jgi:hypothetical protein
MPEGSIHVSALMGLWLRLGSSSLAVVPVVSPLEAGTCHWLEDSAHEASSLSPSCVDASEAKLAVAGVGTVAIVAGVDCVLAEPDRLAKARELVMESMVAPCIPGGALGDGAGHLASPAAERW